MDRMTNSPVEDEIDTIRIDLYEQTKNMSPSERLVYMRKLAAQANAEFGIKTISRVDDSKSA
jgi:hypothetical protein